MEKELSRQIAQFALGLNYRDLPTTVVDEVKRYLYDSMGCAYGARRTKDVQIMRDLCLAMGGTEEATVIGFGDCLPAIRASGMPSR